MSKKRILGGLALVVIGLVVVRRLWQNDILNSLGDGYVHVLLAARIHRIASPSSDGAHRTDAGRLDRGIEFQRSTGATDGTR